jgi:hypothetical protein
MKLVRSVLASLLDLLSRYKWNATSVLEHSKIVPRPFSDCPTYGAALASESLVRRFVNLVIGCKHGCASC